MYIKGHVSILYNTNDQSHICVEGVKRSLKQFYCYSCYFKSKELKVMFAAFTQHCIQSTVILLNLLLMSKGSKVTNTLYTGPLAPPMGKAIYL